MVKSLTDGHRQIRARGCPTVESSLKTTLLLVSMCPGIDFMSSPLRAAKQFSYLAEHEIAKMKQEEGITSYTLMHLVSKSAQTDVVFLC